MKRQDKRGILGLGHAGFGGSAFQGDSLTIGAGNIYLKLLSFSFKFNRLATASDISRFHIVRSKLLYQINFF